MSESDDTDLLLLIPPDFFVIHSDSEDSTQSLKRNSSEHRFKELISQVNELEERVNFIENKDSTLTQNFSEANRVNQTVDYSLSYDRPNYHNVHNRDLALRFHSLASAGFRFGCSSDNTTVQYLEPYIMSSLGNKVHYPHQTYSSTSDSKSESSANRVSYLNPHAHAISVEPSNHQIVNSSMSVDYSTGSCANQGTTADEAHGHHRFSQPSQPFNFNFLHEIDEFLENKNRLGKSQYYNDFCDSEGQGEEKTNKLKVTHKNAECKYERQLFFKLPSTDSASYNVAENKHIDIGRVNGFTQIDTETIFKNQSSDTHSDAIPCTAKADDQSEMEKYRQEFNHHQNEIQEDLFKESSNSEFSSLLKDLNVSKLSKNSIHNSSYTKFLKQSSISGCLDKQPATVTCNSESLPRQSSFIADSDFASEMRETENSRRRSTTSYSGVEENACISSNKSSDNLEGEKNPLQFEFKTDTAWNKDSQTISYENLPTCRNKAPISESFLQDKAVPFPGSANELYKFNNFVHFGDALPESKYEKGTLSKDMQNCYDKNASNLKSIRDKLRNCQMSEFRSDAHSKLPPFSSHSDGNIETQTAGKICSTKHEIEDSIIQSGVTKDAHEHPKKFLFVSDYQSELTTPRPKNLLMNECTFKEVGERNQMSHKSGDGIGKTTGPGLIDDGYYSSIGTGSSAINFLSLSNLWGREAKELQRGEMMTVEQKLEEEHYRRKHCENVIQKLQCTVLEQQQKLAVAVRVDQSKDHTIQQLQTAWKRLINHWQELEEQRHAISIKYSEEKEKHQQNLTDIMQKVKQCELELSKALDLAKGYKEKSEMMEQRIKEQENSYAEEKQTLQLSLQEEQKHVLETEKKLEAIQCELIEIKQKLEETKKEAFAEKESAVKSYEEMKNVQHLLGNLEVDITIVKEENESLRLRLKEERARNDVADQQTGSLKLALDESRKNEKMLRSELKERANIVEKTKADLRDYYQQQVELVVQEKLIEFQTQLDAAEVSLHQEMEQKEKVALEAATKQIKHITEKNLLEVKLLEEKHREELHLCKLQLAQATQQINQLQAQLQSYSNRKIEIVEKLHTVMETQWQEAVRIISGSSPLVQTFQDQQHIISEKDISDSVPDRDHKPIISGNAVPPLLVPHSSSSSTTDEIPFNKEDQLTFRANNEQQCSRGVDYHPENGDVVKKYIEMLLNRPPGNLVDNDTSLEKNCIMQTSVIEENVLPKWGKIMENQQILYNTGKIFPCSTEDPKCIHVNTNSKPNKSDKPPWK